MPRIRASLVLALAPLLASACSGSSKKVAAPVAAEAAEPATFEATADSLAGLLPADVGFVIGASVTRLRESPLWAPIAPQLLAGMQADLDEVKQACGIDVVADADSVLVAGRGAFEDEPDVLVVVKGRWDRDKVNACLSTFAEKKVGKKADMKQDGRYWTYTVEGLGTAHAVWLARDTIAFTGDPEDRGKLASFVEGEAKLAGKPLAGLLGGVDMHTALWGAMLVPAKEAVELAGSLGATPAAFYGQIDFPSGIDAKVAIRFDDDAAAAAFVERASGELEGARQNPFLGGYLAGLALAPQGADAVVTLTMSREQVEQLLGMAMQQLGGMMGGD